MAGRGEPKVERTTSWRWDNVESFIPSEGQNGRRSGDGDHDLAARGASVLGGLEGALLLYGTALRRMSYTDLGVSSTRPGEYGESGTDPAA